MFKKSAAMLAGSFVVYVVASCTSAKIEEAAKVHAVADAAAVDVALDSVIDAIRDALEDGVPADAKADPAPTSGTRLRARYRVEKGADGAARKSFAGWYDSTRKEKCAASWVPLSDGATRCVPDTSGGAVVGYQDSACTRALVVFAATCDVSKYKYAQRIITGACGYLTYTIDVLALGTTEAVMTSTSSWYRQESDGSCSLSTRPWDYLGSSYKTYVATVVAPSEFAALTITEEVE